MFRYVRIFPEEFNSIFIRNMPVILIGVLYAIFVVMTFINSKLMLTNPYPFCVGMLRGFGSGLFLLAYAAFFHLDILKKFKLPTHAWRDLLIFGVFVHGIAMSGFSYGIQFTSPVNFCFIYSANPFITAILQYFLGNEKFTKNKVIALVVGLCGLLPILLATDHGPYANIPEGLEWFGNLVCLGSISLFAFGWIAMKRFLNDYGDYPMAIVNGIPMLAGGCVSAFLFVTSVQGDFSVVQFTPDFPLLMAAFVVSSLVTYLIYPHLLKTYSATFIAFTGFLEPVFGLLLGAAYLGHPITTGSLVSLAVLFAGLYLFYTEEQAMHKTDIRIDPEM